MVGGVGGVCVGNVGIGIDRGGCDDGTRPEGPRWNHQQQQQQQP